MKRFLLATVALAALSAPAAAADLATKYPVKAIPVPVFSWTGFYIGANVGYGGDKTSYDVNWAGVPLADLRTNDGARPFQRDDVWSVSVFLARPGGPATFEIDDVRLTAD